MEAVEQQIGVPVLTDVHKDTRLGEAASVIDVIQPRAFLCRQANFMRNVAKTGRSTRRRACSCRPGSWATSSSGVSPVGSRAGRRKHGLPIARNVPARSLVVLLSIEAALGGMPDLTTSSACKQLPFR